MADEKTVTVIPAPLGLTVIDAEGLSFPIVALQVDGDEVIPLYLTDQGGVRPVFPGQFAMSDAWTPSAAVPYQVPEPS